MSRTVRNTLETGSLLILKPPYVLSIIVPIIYIGKPRLREAKQLFQGYISMVLCIVMCRPLNTYL